MVSPLAHWLPVGDALSRLTRTAVVLSRGLIASVVMLDAVPLSAVVTAMAAEPMRSVYKATRSPHPNTGNAGPAFISASQYSASFAPAVYSQPYVRGVFVANPLVSSEYPATPDYNYLYTAALIYERKPPLASYRYAADMSYLLRAAWGSSSVALVYRWRYCMEAAPAPSIRTSKVNEQKALVSRARGQQIDSALNLARAGEQGGVSQASPSERDLPLIGFFEPSRRGTVGFYRTCLS
jgi:hypothetical protein